MYILQEVESKMFFEDIETFTNSIERAKKMPIEKAVKWQEIMKSSLVNLKIKYHAR
jgi:hypothetical protein